MNNSTIDDTYAKKTIGLSNMYKKIYLDFQVTGVPWTSAASGHFAKEMKQTQQP